MLKCDHEKAADTKMCIHLKDTLEKGARNILSTHRHYCHTGGLILHIPNRVPKYELFVAIGMSTSYQEIRINSVYDKIGTKH